MLFNSLLSSLRTRAAMQAEIMALRHQLMVLQRTRKSKRLALKRGDRCVWVWLSRLWSSWRSALIIVTPETVIAWHRQGFRWYWTWKVAARKVRTSSSSETNQRFDSNNEPREPDLGRTSDSKRTDEVGHQDF